MDAAAPFGRYDYIEGSDPPEFAAANYANWSATELGWEVLEHNYAIYPFGAPQTFGRPYASVELNSAATSNHLESRMVGHSLSIPTATVSPWGTATGADSTGALSPAVIMYVAPTAWQTISPEDGGQPLHILTQVAD